MITLEKFVNEQCKEIAQKYFGLELNVPIRFSNKMFNKLGHMKYNIYSNKPVELAFSNRLFVEHEFEDAISVLKHEVCHWACLVNGKPHGDGEGYFEMELRRIESHSTRTIEQAGNAYVLECAHCGKTLRTYKSENVALKATDKYKNAKWRCCHKGQSVYKGIKTFNEPKMNTISYLANLNQSKNVISKKVDKKENKKIDKKVAKEVITKLSKEKPAQVIKNIFEQIKNDRVIIEKLQNKDFCKKQFGLNYAFISLINVDEKRYYKKQVEVNGKQFFMCNDLYEKNAEMFKQFANSYFKVAKAC